MIQRLPKLLLPQRLRDITSVELRWKALVFDSSKKRGPQCHTIEAYFDFLEELPLTLPGLKKLYLSVETIIKEREDFFEGTILEFVEAVVMAPIDTMVRKFGTRLSKCEIALEETVYNRMEYKDFLKSGAVRFQYKIWRDLPAIGNESALHNKHLDGYWVCSGVEKLLCQGWPHRTFTMYDGY